MSYLYCDVCGEAFAVYKPRLVIAYLPEGEPGEVVSLCGACEERLLDELRLEGPIEEELKEPSFPIHKHRAECELVPYKRKLTKHAKSLDSYLRVFLEPEEVLVYQEQGIDVVTIDNASYILVEIEDEAIVEALEEIPGVFLAHVTFSVVEDEHGDADYCKLDRIEVYATFPDKFAY